MTQQKIALAPLAYYWSRADTLSFYADALSWPVDIVYLGEVVCSRRRELKLEDWLGVAAELRAAGKQVVLSTQTLIDNESDRRSMHRLVERALESDLQLEANDLSAVRTLHALKQSFVAGTHLNIYHGDTLNWYAGLGATRFLPPLEMPGADLAALQQARPAGMETEVQVWGRMALAFSARCFTARHYRLKKDNCEFRCEAHPDGLLLSDREGGQFLNLNGIQTQSAGCTDLSAQLPELFNMQVDVLRIQPQSQNTAEVVATFAKARDAQLATSLPASVFPAQSAPCNGYWFGEAGMLDKHTDAVTAE